MNKKINYIVRYNDKHVINTVYFENDYQMEDFIKMLDRMDYSYIVIKISSDDKKLYNVRSLVNCEDLFE